MDLNISIGSPIDITFQLTSPPLRYGVIQAITNTAPARFTVANHGLSADDKVWITRCRGIDKRINSQFEEIGAATLHDIEVIDSNTFSINAINSVGWGSYTANSGVVNCLTPVNTTGVFIQMQMRRNINDSTPAINLTSTNGGVIISNNGVIYVRGDTNNLTPGSYLYSIEVTYPSGDVDRVLEGVVIVQREVTRA